MSLTDLGVAFSPFRLFSNEWGSSLGTLGSVTLNSSGDHVGFVFRTDAAVTIDAAAFRTSTVTTGGSNALTVTIEGVDPATGLSDGTPIGTPKSVTTVSGTPNSYEVSGIGASLSANTLYALVITWAAGSCAISTGYQAPSGTGPNFPYYFGHDGTTGTLSQAFSLNVCLGTSTSNYLAYPGFGGPMSVAATTITDSGNPDEMGLAFTPPVPCRLIGFEGNVALSSAADGLVKAWSTPVTAATLLNTSGTDLSITIDKDMTGTSASQARGRYALRFPVHYDLTAGVEYGITWRAGASGNFSVLERTWTDADFLRTVGGVWAPRKITRQNDSGNFTGTATSMPVLFPLLSYLDDGQSAGGGPGSNMLIVIG